MFSDEEVTISECGFIVTFELPGIVLWSWFAVTFFVKISFLMIITMVKEIYRGNSGVEFRERRGLPFLASYDIFSNPVMN
jgi:hypothetical protein